MWKRIKLVAIVLLSLVLLYALFQYSTKHLRLSRFSEYAGVSVVGDVDIIYLNDQETFSFKDGRYSIAIRADDATIKSITGNVPSWAKSGWEKGRNCNPARQLEIADHDGIVSLCGYTGSTVFRILTVDLVNGVIYFEMIEF